MPIDFELSKQQLGLRIQAREFADQILRPLIDKVESEPIPEKRFQLTKEAYKAAYADGSAFGFLPKEYGGAGLSTLDYAIIAEELCAVDPGVPTTVVANGLGLMPVVYYGNEEQKDRFLRAATSDASAEFVAGYGVSEPSGRQSGTANFDVPLPAPAGIGLTAIRDGDEYVLNGRKYWPSTTGGWDGQGANLNLFVVRTDPSRGGKSGISAIMVERGTPGISYKAINKMAHHGARNDEVICKNVRVPAKNLIEGTFGNGDLLINRNFGWSGPLVSAAALGNARGAYECALEWAKNNSAGGPEPIIKYQNVGYVLGDVATRIEACRYFVWKAAHYLDSHNYHGEMIGAMCKSFVTETMFDCVYKCMQVVGTNSADRKLPFAKFFNESAIFPIYDGGNFGMQRRRVHGILADPGYDTNALAENRLVEFTRDMEGIDTVPGASI